MTSPDRWLILTLFLAACASPPEEGGFRLEDAGVLEGFARPASGLSLPVPDQQALEAVDVEAADERRRAVLLPAAEWSWRGRLPRDAALALGVAPPPAERGGLDRLAVRVELLQGRVKEIVDLVEGDGSGWLDVTADLGAWAGEEVTLRVIPEVAGPAPPGRLAWSWTGVLPRRRVAGGSGQPPSILFILIDTLRADHLTPYGYRRETSPHIQRLLAERGVVVEEAYAQAPWTVPSAVSYMTGRYPGELLTGPIEGYHIPAEVPTLAEELGRLGYATGAFYGNFTLRDANGFGRGFATRYTPPAVPDSNFLHADTVNARALPWLRAHQHRPFFAYVHYMDPHDPYLSPELVGGRSPYYPDYRGKLGGLHVHGVFMGNVPLESPEEDVAHLTALYDSEIHYVDKALGELIDSLSPEVLANTLIVLTSDHGEELFDHGGWKHGQTLYQDQIHVPLLLRWDGRLPAGTRLPGTAQLLDLLPTLVAAAGGEAREGWQGIDLLPALRGEAALPRRPAFAHHLASGPLRAAAIFAGKKLILFNRAEPFPRENLYIQHLWRVDLGRLERQELYDLVTDPGERSNLAGRDPRASAALEPVIHHRLDQALPGLRLIASGLPPGARLGGRIELGGPVAAWHPYFLSPDDRISWMGPVLSFELVGETAAEGEGPAAGALAEKGLWLEGVEGSIRAIELWLDGQPLPPSAVRLGGDGAPYRGGGVELQALAAGRRPPAPAGPALRLWTREGGEARAGAIDPEVERSLRALGYVQ